MPSATKSASTGWQRDKPRPPKSVGMAKRAGLHLPYLAIAAYLAIWFVVVRSLWRLLS
jgi:hypothetical protein